MEEAADKGIFKGYMLPNNGPHISIIQFANDTIFLGEWSKNNTINLLRILRCFHACSGLKINIEKCSLMGVGVRDGEIEELARVFKCAKGSLPFTYLRMPVGGSMRCKSSWDTIINKFHSKLSSWKARNLSFGGRLVLCKSVLGSLGTYLFSLYKAPENVLAKLESIRRKFFWGMKNDAKKINWIAWKKVLNSEANGGLNIGSFKALNLAFLGKWWWRFFKEEDGLWKKVITSIHGDNGNLGGVKRSGCWGSICHLNKYIDIGGNIDFRHLFFEEENGMEWGLEDDGTFSVKSLRRAIDEHLLEHNMHHTTFFKCVPKKANILLWRACLGRLPTRLNLLKRNILTSSSLCPLCNICEEAESHLFLECSFVDGVRRLLSLWYPEFICNAPDLLHVVKEIERAKRDSRQLKEVVHLSFLYCIWGYRNDIVQLGKVKCAKELVITIKHLAFNWYRSRNRLACCLNLELWLVNPIHACTSLISH